MLPRCDFVYAAKTASRGDQTTVQRNLEALKGDPFEEVYSAFVSAYERQGKLAIAAGRKDWLSP
jgi:hypothetical protein